MPDFIEQLTPFEILDTLPAYDLNDGTSSMLDLARQVIDSEEYFFQGYCWPQSGDSQVASLANFEGQISIPWGSYIMSISAFTDQTDAGFDFQIYDQGAKHSLFGRTFGHNFNVGNFGFAQNIPTGPTWMLEPYIVLKPGQFQMQLTNLSANTANVQVYLSCAVPISRETLNVNTMKRVGGNV